MKIFLFSQSSLRNKKSLKAGGAPSLCLNPGNHNHFEVDGAKSKLQYLEGGSGNLINNEAYFEQNICCKSSTYPFPGN